MFKKRAWLSALGAFILLAAPSMTFGQNNMNITSPYFSQGESIPANFTCNGEDVNPLLMFEGVPGQAQSLALIIDDPDAPMGTWNHWVMWNIDAATKKIDENSVPSGANLGTNSFNRLQYGGPCPPSGAHRYFFRLYALDTRLDLAEGATRQDLEQAMQGHIVAQAELMGTYSQPR